MPVSLRAAAVSYNPDYEVWEWASDDSDGAYYAGDTVDDPEDVVPGYDSEADCNCLECVRSRDPEAWGLPTTGPSRPESEHWEETDDGLVAPRVAPLALALEPMGHEVRPARMVSFEQEIGGNARTVATRLYEHGLTSEPRVWEYHGGNTEWLHVEHDGSVDGEVIFSRLRLDNPQVAARAEQALDVIGGCLTDGSARLDSRCGFHVHVGLGYDGTSGARCFSMGAVQSLYHLWNHVEDTVYRLGAANWGRHRQDRGNSYSPVVRKGLTGARGIGERMRRDRAALNLAPFLGSRSSCTCGAFEFGEWESCTCEGTPKPTVEFRVFNATANKRKVRAYTALALALVAYAEQNEVTPERFPVHAWQGSALMPFPETSEAVLRFILRDLPLTDPEREDLRYCAEQSMKGGAGSLRPVVRRIRRRKGGGLRAARTAPVGR